MYPYHWHVLRVHIVGEHAKMHTFPVIVLTYHPTASLSLLIHTFIGVLFGGGITVLRPAPPSPVTLLPLRIAASSYPTIKKSKRCEGGGCEGGGVGRGIPGVCRFGGGNGRASETHEGQGNHGGEYRLERRWWG